MRLNVILSVLAMVLAISVLPSPGTPTIRAWPRQSKAASRLSRTTSCPTITRPISCRNRSRAARKLFDGLDIVVARLGGRLLRGMCGHVDSFQ